MTDLGQAGMWLIGTNTPGLSATRNVSGFHEKLPWQVTHFGAVS